MIHNGHPANYTSLTDATHPNFQFNQLSMLERCVLRNGNVHSADGWRDVLDQVITRYAKRDILRLFRADPAYAMPAIYARLEEAGYLYAIRLPANTVLRENIEHRVTRPVGQPSLTKVKRFLEDFDYQAQSWEVERPQVRQQIAQNLILRLPVSIFFNELLP